MATQTGKWSPGAELKALGDRVIPSPITIAFSGYEGRPDLEVTFEVMDGQLQCRRVLITAISDQEIQKRDLVAVKVDDLREMVASNWSMPRTITEGRAVVTLLDMPTSTDEMADAKRNLQATRRRADSDHLGRVAEVYLSADHAPTQAVADAFNVAHRTAGLYVQRARRAGLIPPAERGN